MVFCSYQETLDLNPLYVLAQMLECLSVAELQARSLFTIFSLFVTLIMLGSWKDSTLMCITCIQNIYFCQKLVLEYSHIPIPDSLVGVQENREIMGCRTQNAMFAIFEK